MPYRGPGCSEVVYVPGTHPPPEDCQAASGIDIANCSTGGEFPVTAVEREALRVDSGDTTGGMDLAHLRIGLDKRYGLTGVYFQTLDSIEKALAGGWALVINGWLDATPKSTWMQNTGTVYHAEAFNEGDKPGFCHMWNPLAPKGHLGWEVPVSVAIDFARSSASGRGSIKGIYCLGLPERPQSGPIGGEVLKISSIVPVLIDLPMGAQLYDTAFQPLVKVSVAKKDQVSPYEVERSANSHCRVAHIAIGGVEQMVLINDGDANIRPIPPTAGDVKHTVTVAVDGATTYEVKV